MNPQIARLESVLAAEHQNIAGLLVQKNGETVYAKNFNDCPAHCPVHLFSVTKSIVSLLVGIAIHKGYLQSVHQKVLDFFPDYTPKWGEKTLQTITLQHLLTMTAPYKYRSAPYTKVFTSDDWVRSALDLLGGRSPAGTFRYTPLIGPDLLTGILRSATGQSLRCFANAHLFGPLGFAVEKDIVFEGKEDQFAFLRARGISGWVADPSGNHTAGWGLCLSAENMAQIGLLCLQDGFCRGVPIVPAGWLAESTREHSRWLEADLPFGYLWWPAIANGYAAMGDSGNLLYISPSQRLVVAITALYKPSANDRIPLITQYIEPIWGRSA